MRPKQILKISVDAGMLLFFVLQMAYHITGNTLHEWLGTILFALFILHHIWNLNWYKTLFKGKYSAVRILMTSINVLLFAAMAGMMVSGVMLSREVFGFLNLRAGMFGRRLHMISTSWGYLLMSAHIGLHFGMGSPECSKRKSSSKANGSVWPEESPLPYYPLTVSAH